MANAFTRFASWGSAVAGHHLTAIGAMLVVAGWLAIGPLVAFSDTWLLLRCMATSIVAFLMVFLIQHTQNRDAAAVHLKLENCYGRSRAPTPR